MRLFFLSSVLAGERRPLEKGGDRFHVYTLPTLYQYEQESIYLEFCIPRTFLSHMLFERHARQWTGSDIPKRGSQLEPHGGNDR